MKYKMIHKPGPRKMRSMVLFILLGALFGTTMGVYLALTHDLPQIRQLEEFKPSAVTRIYSSDGVLLSELFVEKRDPVPIEMIPEHLITALLTTEDRNFYQHSGVDLKGILRAVVRNIRTGRFAQGASTITQQLARTLFLTPKKNLLRKLREAVLALQLERRYTKDELLELYLNQVYFGSGAYGVEAAANIFFGKSVKDLSLAECALVAGMPKSPSRYSPLINMDLALWRRNIVLRQMHETGAIQPDEYRAAQQSPVVLGDTTHRIVKAPHFVRYVKSALEDQLGSDQLYKGGLTLFTTLSNRLQSAAEAAVAAGLEALQTRMQQQGIAGPLPEAALTALDVKTGAILAMVGGRDYEQSRFNRGTSAKRQPGSAFKPILYAYAIEHGFSQNRLLLDAPVAFNTGDDVGEWRPENFSGTYYGEITLRMALTHSKNIPAVRLIETLGPDSISRFGHTLGIASPLKPNLSLALGTSEVNLLELTSVYAVFANQGKKITPYGILEATDRNGRIVWQTKPEQRVVLSPATAAIITDILEGVVKEGTGRSAEVLKRPVAGKTGTTNAYKDALFIGYTPHVAAGVWVGRDDHGSLGDGETGARAALPIWIQFMETVLEGQPFHAFDLPDDMVRISMDPFTGKSVPPQTPEAVEALFRKDNAPK